MNIDLDESGLRRKQARPAQGEPVVDAFANDEEQVGFPERGVNRVVERGVGVAHRQRVVVGYRAAPHGDGVQRNLSQLDEAAKGLFRARPPDAAAGDQDGPLGRAQQPDGAIRVGQALWPVKRWPCREPRPSSAACEQIHRNGQMHRPLPSAIGLGVGALQVRRNLRGIGHLRGPLHHRARHPHLVDILKSLAASQRAGAAAAHRDQRTAGEVGGGHPGE